MLRLFIHPAGNGCSVIPKDLREKLKAFVPKPPAAQLASLEQIPAQPPRVRTTHRFDKGKGKMIYDSHEAPLILRLTEPAAIQDLRTTLRLIDQEKLPVSATTLLPSKGMIYGPAYCGTLESIPSLLHHGVGKFARRKKSPVDGQAHAPFVTTE